MGIGLIDVCLRCYFQGSSNEVLAVPVDNNTTCRDLREALLLENMSGSTEWDYQEAIYSLFQDKDLTTIAFPYLEPSSEEDDSCYAYFCGGIA